MLLFVAADPMEFRGLTVFCRNVAPAALAVDWARRADLHGEPIVMIANGAGAANVGWALEAWWGTRFACPEPAGQGPALPTCRAVISTGFCGALDPALGIGDVFVATAIAGAPIQTPHSERPHAQGALVSIDRVAQTAAEKRKLRARGAAAVDMEAAGLYERARRLDLPFYCVRAVTDLADETFANDLNAALRPDGHFATMQILRSAMRHPFVRIPELARLRKRCTVASRALGEFFADCRF